jgi:predicted Zn-dependent protease
MKIHPWTLGVMLVVAAACATNPATGRRQLMLMSEEQEIALGRESDVEIRKQMAPYKDEALQAYVKQIGSNLVSVAERPNLPWTYIVVDSPAVNAFALPGGFIYLTRGILPYIQDEAELAGVLGHETGHVTARHSAAMYSRQTALGGGLGVLGVLVPEAQPLTGLAGTGLQLLFLRNSRDAELEADQLGTRYMAARGWDPGGMPGLLATLGRLNEASGTSRGIPNWALTHPPAEDRVTRVQEAVAAARASGARTTNKPGFDRHIDGLIFGDSRESGIVRGNQFIHPIMRFAMEFPRGWEIANGAEQVSARESQESNVGMILTLAPGTGSLERVAQAQMAQAGLQQTSGAAANINGLQAYVGVYQGAAENTSVAVRAAHIRSGNQTYLIAGIAPPGNFSRADQLFVNTIRSFRAIGQQEADRVQPSRVDFYTVRANDTWESIARGVSGESISPANLAVMNGTTLATRPRPGDRIRVVVGG